MGFLVNEGKPFLQNVIPLLLEHSVLRGKILKVVKKKKKGKNTIHPKVISTLKKYVEAERKIHVKV